MYCLVRMSKLRAKFILILTVDLAVAHCFQNKGYRRKISSHEVIALLGKHDLKIADEFGSKKALVWDIVIHPDWNFNDRKFDADIAIAVLTEAVELSDEIQLVCLPQPSLDEVAHGTAEVVGTVVGFGKSESSAKDFGAHSSTPNELLVPAVNSSHCYTTFDRLASISSNRMFCGGYEGQAKAPCSGDSGSGFYLFESSSNTWNVRGIVSASFLDFDLGCDVNMFSLYTNVARFIEWIKKTMEENREVIWSYIDFDCVKAKG